MGERQRGDEVLVTDRVPKAASEPVGRREVALLALATVAVVGTGVIFLVHRQFWVDESFTYVASSLPAGDLWRWATSSTGELNMALYYSLVSPLSHAQASDLVMRLPSVVAMVATVPIVWLIANRLSGRRYVRVAAVLLFITHPLMIDYAFEARSYAILTAAVAALTLLLMRALDPSRTASLAYALLLPLLIGLQFVAVFVVIAHAIALLAFGPGSRSERVWRTARLTGPAIVVSAGALLIFCRQPTLESRGAFGPSTIARTAYNVTGRAGPLSLLIVVAAVAGLVVLWRRRHVDRGGAVVALTLLVPLTVAALLSVSRNMFLANYLLDVVPMLACVSAVGLAALVTDRRYRIGLLAAAVVLGLAGQAAIYRSPDREQPDSATRVVLANAGSEDQIAFRSPAAALPYEHLLDSRNVLGPAVIGQPTGTSVGATLRPDAMNPDLSVDLPEGASLWLVLSRANRATIDQTRRRLTDAGLVVTQSWSFSNVELQRWERTP